MICHTEINGKPDNLHSWDQNPRNDSCCVWVDNAAHVEADSNRLEIMIFTLVSMTKLTSYLATCKVRVFCLIGDHENGFYATEHRYRDPEVYGVILTKNENGYSTEIDNAKRIHAASSMYTTGVHFGHTTDFLWNRSTFCRV